MEGGNREVLERKQRVWSTTIQTRSGDNGAGGGRSRVEGPGCFAWRVRCCPDATVTGRPCGTPGSSPVPDEAGLSQLNSLLLKCCLLLLLQRAGRRGVQASCVQGSAGANLNRQSYPREWEGWAACRQVKLMAKVSNPGTSLVLADAVSQQNGQRLVASFLRTCGVSSVCGPLITLARHR